MLVKYCLSAVFTGDYEVAKGLFKKITFIRKEYIRQQVCGGICDSTEVETKINEALPKVIEEITSWGYSNVEVCTDACDIIKMFPYETKDWAQRKANLEPSIVYLSTLKVADVIKLVNGKQFAQYCKENEIIFEKTLDKSPQM